MLIIDHICVHKFSFLWVWISQNFTENIAFLAWDSKTKRNVAKIAVQFSIDCT